MSFIIAKNLCDFLRKYNFLKSLLEKIESEETKLIIIV